jgi:hypothetical protein
VDLAVTGDDGDRTRDVAGVKVTTEHVSHASQPFRREAASGHVLLLIVSVLAAGSRAAPCRPEAMSARAQRVDDGSRGYSSAAAG